MTDLPQHTAFAGTLYFPDGTPADPQPYSAVPGETLLWSVGTAGHLLGLGFLGDGITLYDYRGNALEESSIPKDEESVRVHQLLVHLSLSHPLFMSPEDAHAQRVERGDVDALNEQAIRQSSSVELGQSMPSTFGG